MPKNFFQKYFNLQKNIRPLKEAVERDDASEFYFSEPDQNNIKNPEIFKILTHPEFYKTFAGPADFQYEILRNNFLEDPESAKNSLGLLKNILHDNSKTIFPKVLLLKWLRTAIGDYSNRIRNHENYSEISKILQTGISTLQNMPDTPYLLNIYLQKDNFFKQINFFESQELELTPIKITDDIYIQDNKFDSIPVFYHVSNQRAFDLIIKEQAQRFELARPENTSEPTKKPTLKELQAYKEKYTNAKIHSDSYLEEIRSKNERISVIFKPEELLQYFPNSKNIFEERIPCKLHPKS